MAADGLSEHGIGRNVFRLRTTGSAPYIVLPALPGYSQALRRAGPYGGFLGRKFEPLTVGDVSDSAVVLDGLEPQPDLPLVRQTSRTSLLDAIDRTRRQFNSDRNALEMSELYRQAHSLLESPQCRHAFDLSQESDRVRDRYGRFRSGQACLLARRLVEAGVPLITVFLNHSARGQD